MQSKAISFRASKRRHPLFLFIIAIIITALFPSSLLANADKIFKENNKAVVVVVTYNAKGEPISQGSGFIVRPDGAVITNYHVISNAVDIAVKAGDKVLKVEGLLHVDKENDLVILKAKGKDLPFVKIGDIGKMNIGEKVYVISSPQGLENTISDGILSGVREITPKKKILQISAPVSSGSSGGPVFNKNGEVIGIATFIIKEAQNLNFAMHVNLIKNKIGSKKVIALDVAIEVYGKSEEEYNKEIEDYSKAIASDPNYAFAYYTIRGNAYANKKQYDRAIEDYNKAIALEPKYASAYYGRGGSYYFKGQYDRAISDYDKAIALNPSRFSHDYLIALTYHIRGSNYYYEKQYDKAIEDYDKAIELYPNYDKAYEDRGVCYWRGKGQYDRAISDYDKAIALHENSPEALKSDTEAYRRRASAYHGRAMIHYEKGQYDKAIEDYSKVISLNPYAAYSYMSALIYSERGDAYAGKKEYDKAIADYNKAIALHNDDSYYIYRGLAYAGKKQYNKAIEDYSKVIAYPNYFALTYFYRGLAYAENKQYDRAIKDYNKIIASSSDFVLAYFYRGNTYYDKGRYDKAIEDYSKVIALNPNDTEAFFYHKDGYDNRIVDFNRKVRDDIRTIIEDYSKVITLNPNNAYIYIKRGLAYSLSGNRGKAISDFQKACDFGNEVGCKTLEIALKK